MVEGRRYVLFEKQNIWSVSFLTQFPTFAHYYNSFTKSRFVHSTLLAVRLLTDKESIEGQFHANWSLEGKIKSEPILKGDCNILKRKICSFQIKNRFHPAIVVQILQQFDLSASFRLSHTKFSAYLPSNGLNMAAIKVLT